MTTISSKSPIDTISKLSNYLPTGTFLTFQAVAPLFTNNGDCGRPEKVVTSLLILTMGVGNILLAYTDSMVITSNGKSYYGLVTRKGLYNPNFPRFESSIPCVKGSFFNLKRFHPTIFDFCHAILTAAVFLTLTILTPPVQSCFFPRIPNTIVKSIPILVALIAGSYFAVAPTPRKSLGYAADATDDDDDLEAQNAAARARTAITDPRQNNSNNTGTNTSVAAADHDAEIQSSSELVAPIEDVAKGSPVSPTHTT